MFKLKHKLFQGPKIQKSNANVQQPHNLPPAGPISRPKPQQGQKFYVLKASNYSEWVPATVMGTINREDVSKVSILY